VNKLTRMRPHPLGRRFPGMICHGRPRRPLEPLAPRTALLRAIGWLVATAGLGLLAAVPILVAASIDTKTGAEIAAIGFAATAAGLVLRVVAALVRPNTLSVAAPRP
jgi:hypothetical protein